MEALESINPSPSSPRAETPVVLQLEASECGAAALGSILAYHGKPVPLSELRAACGVTPAHADWRSILTAARAYGLKARIYRGTPEDVRARRPRLPALASWNGNHIVVVEGFENGNVHLNDPSCGPKTVTGAVFQNAFGNLLIAFSPTWGFLAPQPLKNGHRPQEDGLMTALGRGLKGDVFSEPVTPFADYTHNFGGMERQAPRLVVRAVCEQDLVHTLQVARARGVPVAIRGAGHSCMSHSLCEGGLVLVNAAAHASLKMLDGRRVEVTTRSRWQYLEDELNRLGRSVPVLTSHLGTTVGGTLSVGGYGMRSVAYGAQVHQVERLRLITPDGTALWCSSVENADLFRYSLAGLGQVGIIERVVLRTIPHHPRIAWYVYQHSSMAALLDAISWLAEGSRPMPDHFIAMHLGGQGTFACYGLTGAQDADYRPLVDRLEQHPRRINNLPDLSLVECQAWTPATCHPAVDYILEFDQLRQFLPFVEQQLSGTVLGRYTVGFLLLAISHSGQNSVFPFEASAFGREPVKFLVGLYPVVPRDQPDDLAEIQALLRRILQRCLELGGRPYLYGWHALTPETKQRLYGPAYETLGRLRQRLDPGGLFNAGGL